MSKTLKYILIGSGVIGGLCIIGFLIFNFMIASAFGAFDKTYSVTELKEEYFSKEKEIQDVINYYDFIKPKDYTVDIEFTDEKLLSRLTIYKKDSSKVVYQKWDVPIGEMQSQELTTYLEWSGNEVKTLKEKLDKANCISVEDGEPIKIGFKRSGMGMFSFVIFRNKGTDIQNFNNGCDYIMVNRNLALQYGGGAIGPQCFPNKN
jgi:hypothetical protein